MVENLSRWMIVIYICVITNFRFKRSAYRQFRMILIPAIKGPSAKGNEVKPRMNPIAWDAPKGPQMWTAIGPNNAE